MKFSSEFCTPGFVACVLTQCSKKFCIAGLLDGCWGLTFRQHKLMAAFVDIRVPDSA